VTDYCEKEILVNGSSIRVRQKGAGLPLALLTGFGGAPEWPEFADRLTACRTVYLISLPGQDGSERGHDHLHTPLDWISATQEAIELATGRTEGVDIVACSVAGMLASDIAALSGKLVRSLVLIDPLGLYDPANAPRNPFDEAPSARPKMLMEDQEGYKRIFSPPAHLEEMERRMFEIVRYRCDEATARLIWPFGDIKGNRRLHRISCATLLIWGAKDKIIPPVYAESYARLIQATTRIEAIPGAGHLSFYDQPERVADIVLNFLGSQ
jgi:pimeloyl-ACP methyl ester carboxylesterase